MARLFAGNGRGARRRAWRPTLDSIASHHAQFRARRTEFYHLAAGELLRRFDRVQVGNWIGLVPGAAEARKRNAKLIERLTGAPAPGAQAAGEGSASA